MLSVRSRNVNDIVVIAHIREKETIRVFPLTKYTRALVPAYCSRSCVCVEKTGDLCYTGKSTECLPVTNPDYLRAEVVADD
jgi:hypothetical protein